MKIPGVAWVALIGLLITWLNNYFPNETWLVAAVAGLGLVAKLVEVYMPKAATTNERFAVPKPPPSKPVRVLLGG